METVGEQKLWSISDKGRLQNITCFNIRKGRPYEVKSYLELAQKVAALQFKNPDYVLLFRGQRKDYFRRSPKGTDYTALPPSIFRGVNGNYPLNVTIKKRFEKLLEAEKILLRHYEVKKYPEIERIKRQRILRWSLLQHYEICKTPVLDVTHSLRIAASFASPTASDEGYLFVIAVPNLSGAITASAAAGVQIVRLSSVCPPNAVRPHIQEGYLLGEYPEIADYSQKENYPHYEIDFGRRLIAKFRFRPVEFWKTSPLFPPIDPAALYPDANDPLYDLAQAVKAELREEL